MPANEPNGAVRSILSQLRKSELLKRAGRTLTPPPIARAIRSYLGDVPRQDRFAYAWLNELCESLVEEGKGLVRPSYTWGAIQGAFLASTLGIDRVSLVEFGVAGGRGLISLDKIVEPLEREFSIQVSVYGFDTGEGLPGPSDYRDLPNIFSAGGYPMKQTELRKRLRHAQLILGPVKETVPEFIASQPPPVAFVSNDLDLYTSTRDSFALFKAEPGILMPRIHCHFDDILGFTFADHNGERLAITEFNAEMESRKLSPIFGLKYFLPPQYFDSRWADKAYMVHVLDHPQYNDHDGLVLHEILDLDA